MTQVFRQSRARTATRRIFAALIVCWLNLTLLPCAMAFESDEHCAQMAVMADAEMAGHAGHHAAEPRPDCDMVSAECCDLADAMVDGRNGKFELSVDELSVNTLAPSWPALQIQNAAIDDERPPDRRRRATPLHVLHCVYLK